MLTDEEVIIDEFLYGSPEVSVVAVEYTDGTYRFFTFDCEDYKQHWAERLVENSLQWGIERVLIGDTVLNFTDDDASLYILH